MPDLDLADIRLHFEDEGSGEPVILLAGMLSDSASWGPVVPLLTDRHRVIRPDNRTTGRTTPWDAPVSVGQMTQDALALLDHLGVERFHIVGHSMGGLMGMELSGLAGGRVASLSVLASAPVRVPRTMAVFDMLAEVRGAENGETLWLKALYPWLFRPGFFTDPAKVQAALDATLGYPYGQSRAAMLHQLEALRTFRPRTRLAEISCPTQTVFAGHDLLIPEEEGRQAFDVVAGVEQHRIDDAGHSLHWDAPQDVASRVLDFIARHPA